MITFSYFRSRADPVGLDLPLIPVSDDANVKISR